MIYKVDPRPCIPPRVVALSAIGLKLGYLGFSRPHTQKQTQNKCIHNLCVPFGISTGVYLHFQTAVDAGDIMLLTNHDYFLLRGNPNIPNLSPMRESKWPRLWDLPCTSVSGFMPRKYEGRICRAAILPLRMACELLYLQIFLLPSPSHNFVEHVLPFSCRLLNHANI